MTTSTIARPVTQTAVPGGTLTARLAAWIGAEGIAGNYGTAGIASRITTEVHPSLLEQWLDTGATSYLRGMCQRIKDDADLTDAEWAAENYFHGHLAGNGRATA